MRDKSMRTSLAAAAACLVVVSSGTTSVTAQGPSPAADAPAFQAYSKYDFVAGEKIVAFEDFSDGAIGDFPARWNTNASAEIVTIAGKPGRWLKVTGGGFFIPELGTALPDNFTLEFDLITAPQFNAPTMFGTALLELANPKAPAAWRSSANVFQLRVRPGRTGEGTSATELRQAEVSAAATNKSTTQFKSGEALHVSLWRQRERIRVYLNDEKAWDVARALPASANLNSLLFFVPEFETGSEYYAGNLRLAVGAPDTRNKLLTEGKWVTHGILFDPNSDRIKPESYGALKEIAGVLAENADLKVQIVGHTDADGDAAQNLELSKRRAASVRSALTKEFAIAETRLEIDGKGETQPVDKNDTTAGKANNRRVEFIKK